MAFIFYDVETTGKITSFDQILQFAAIKVDDNLDELDRYEVRCRLLPYVVPSPKALQMAGVAPEMITEPGLPSHYEAMRQIRAKLTEWSPAIFIGFNSIEFDEELLRRAFFQTLHPVYLTNTDGNARADVMRIVQAASVYAPDCILVPRGNRGRMFSVLTNWRHSMVISIKKHTKPQPTLKLQFLLLVRSKNRRRMPGKP